MASRKKSSSDHGRRRSKSAKCSYSSAAGTVQPATNNMFANDGSFMDMFKRTIASNVSNYNDGNRPSDPYASTVDGQQPIECRMATAMAMPQGLPTTSSVSGHSYHHHHHQHQHEREPGEMTSSLLRTLPTGATYAAAATTYVHSANLIPIPPDEMRRVGVADNVDEQLTTHRSAAASTSTSTTSAEPTTTKKTTSSLLSFVGKRRGGKTLPTGMVKKAKVDEAAPPVEKGRTDAWSQYMAEVRKYKEMSCEDEGKTRPLVK